MKAHQTKSAEYEALATRQLPDKIFTNLNTILGAVENIKAEARNSGVTRNFTLDGRFLGDIGEFLAKKYFGVELHRKQKTGQDGICEVSGNTVEVKLRSKAPNVFVESKPDILLVIYLSPKTHRWGVICNGPGKELLADAKWNGNHKRYETNLSKLLAAQRKLTLGFIHLAESPVPTVEKV